MRMLDPCPHVIREVRSVAGNQQWWEYLHHGNLQPSPHLPPSTPQEDQFTPARWNEEIIEIFLLGCFLNDPAENTAQETRSLAL